MGAVRSSLVLNDGMTSTLRRINKAMGLMLNNFEAVQRASGQAINTQDIAQARQEIGRANAQLDEMERNYREINDQQSTLNKQLNSGNKSAGGLLSKLKGVAAAYLGMKTLGSLVELSDTQAQTEARLNLMVDDNNTVDSLEAKIRASATRARAAYQTTADAVSKLGMQAGDAFSSNDELIAFTELLNKSFVVAGTSASGVDSVMLQLTQALAAGKLQGEELNAVLDNAQPIVANIKRYLTEVEKIDASNIKELASEGVLTADIIKNAMFYCADDINTKFNAMPMTWGQVWTGMKDKAILSLEPVLQKIGELASDQQVQNTISGLLNGFALLAQLLLGVFNIGVKVYNFFAKNWSTLGPLVWGIVAAFAAYNTALLIHKGYLAGAAIVEGIKAVAAYASAKATLKAAEAAGVNTAALGSEAAAAALAAAGLTAEQVATAAATVGQTAFNTALWACPITWIIAAVIALIVVFFMFTEQIMGAIYWLGALFKNIGLWIANCGIAAWEVIKNVGLWFANLGLSIWAVIKNIGLWFANLGHAAWAIIKNTGLWFANLGMGIWNVLKAAASNVGTAFSNAWISIQIGFWSMVNAVMQGIKSLAEKANKCLGWMGVNIDTSGLDFASKKIDELNGKKESYKSISEAWDEGFNTFAYENVGDAMSTYDYASVTDAWNTNDLDWSKVGEGFNTFDTFEDGWGSDAYSKGAEVGAGIKDAISFDKLLGGAGGDAGAASNGDLLGYGDTLEGIAGDTSSIAGGTDKTTEELAYLRDIAEQEAINRFTTAEVKIDMTGMTNRIDGSLDIDGVVDELTTGFVDALTTAAEGVHDDEL